MSVADGQAPVKKESAGATSDNERLSRQTKAGGPQAMEGIGELLIDPTAAGKERPWGDKHQKSQQVAKAYWALGEQKKAARCRDCGTVLTFNECPIDGQKRLKQANFCRERLCPMCAWRRSLKWAAEVTEVLHVAAAEHPEWSYVMLTLTQRNVPSEQLRGEITRMLAAWSKLTRRRDFGAVAGWLRTVEVTRNNKPGPWQGTWHPHMHALLAVKPDYWAGRNYVSQKRWRELWMTVMGLDYDPRVEVHKVKERTHNDSLSDAAREVAKYTVKDSDLVTDGPDTIARVETLDKALKGRHLLAWGGALKEIAQRLAADLPEGEEDLIRITGEDHGPNCPVCGTEMLTHTYRWMQSIRQYVG